MSTFESEADQIFNFFFERHTILKFEWLKSVAKYLNVSNFPRDNYIQLVYDQWIRSDLEKSTESSFERPMGRIYEGHCVLQIEKISTSPENDVFQLSDGKNKINAVEQKWIPGLLEQSIGGKIFICGPVQIENDMFLLNPNNCQILGGYFKCKPKKSLTEITIPNINSTINTINTINNGDFLAEPTNTSTPIPINTINNINNNTVSNLSESTIPQTPQIPSISNFSDPNFYTHLQFFEKMHIHLNSKWLQTLLKFLGSRNVPSNNYNKAIYDQWLRSDFRKTTEGTFQKPIGRIYDGKCVFQITYIKEISSSEQSKKKQQEDLDIQTPMNYENDEGRKIPTKRMLLLNLTDGKTNMNAVEHESIPNLSGKVVGCKILIFGPIRIKDDFFLLTPKNCQILGGYC